MVRKTYWGFYERYARILRPPFYSSNSLELYITPIVLQVCIINAVNAKLNLGDYTDALHYYVQPLHMPPESPHRRRKRRRKDERLQEMEEREANDRGLTKYVCPCNQCHGGGRPVLRSTIRKHLRTNGRDPFYNKSILVSINMRMC